jgi:pimeloyl-ACP methyl ester carboxylesterase
MATIQVHDHSIYYDVHGQGQPLVLIAGLGASRMFWWKQTGPLSHSYRTITLDNRGIGDSSRAKASFTIADMADDVAALIKALDLGPTHVLGISMGGFIAATLSVRHPEQVRKLILSSTSAGGATHVKPADDIIRLFLGADDLDIEASTRLIYTAITGPNYVQNHPEELDHFVRNNIEKPLPLETYLYQLNAINRYSDGEGVKDKLDQISIPTLVIHGDQDPLVPYPNGRYLADHIQGARLLTYPDVGHLPPVEATDRFNADVIDFLGIE